MTSLLTSHPHLAAELVDADLAKTLSRGSAKKVEWRCSLGHTWTASPNSRTSMGSGCGVCAGKVIVAGVNDLASQNPDLAAEMVDQDLATTLTPKSGKKVKWRCSSGHIWTASVNTRAVGHGCPVCTGKKVKAGDNDLATTHPEVAAQLADPSQATTVTPWSAKVLEWKCSKGHTWTAPVARITGGAGCGYCSGMLASPGETDLATKRPDLAAELVDKGLATTLKENTNRKVDWICTKGHTWSASPNARANGGTGCPVCANRTVLQGFNDLAATHPDIAAEAVDDVSDVTYGSQRPVKWRCASGHTWVAKPINRTLSGSGCPECAAKRFVSAGEAELAEIVRRLMPECTVRTSARDLLYRQELDIVVVEKGLAIEFNGTWWHSEAYLANDYHADKTRAAEKVGLRLVHVWADDWAERKELVIRAVAHRLGASHRITDVLPHADPAIAERVFARKLALGTTSSAEARAFWQDNHLQGPVGSSHYFSLRDDDGRIRALLGVGAKNHGSRATPTPGTWDVQRYATRGTVPGGFTRLLSHATEQLKAAGLPVMTWTSYSDDDLSEGGMYRAAGFVADKRQPPSYSYIGGLTGWKRVHRTRFVKQRFVTDETLLYEEGWTEHQAALANGLYRVYDAGKTRWTKDVS